jgi:hypothetical protein
MNDSNSPYECSCKLLLPWYANGTLRRNESQRVAYHMAVCADCARELETIQRLYLAYKNPSMPPGWQPSARGFADLESKLGSAQPERTLTNQRKVFKVAWPILPWRLLTLPGLVTAQAIVIIFLVGVIGMQTVSLPSYQTLAYEPPVALAVWPELSVVFSDNATERDIRNLLQACHGQIVRGPSVLGIYTIQLHGILASNVKPIMTLFQHHPKVKLVIGETPP